MAQDGCVYRYHSYLFIIFWRAENVIILGVQLHSNGSVTDVVSHWSPHSH